MIIPRTFIVSGRSTFYVPLLNSTDRYAEIKGGYYGTREIITPHGVLLLNDGAVRLSSVLRRDLGESTFVAPFLAYQSLADPKKISIQPLDIDQDVPTFILLGMIEAYIPVNSSGKLFFKLYRGESRIIRVYGRSWMKPVELGGEDWYASPCLWRKPQRDDLERLDFDEGVIHPFVFDPLEMRVVREDQ